MKRGFVISGGSISLELLSKVLHKNNLNKEDIIIAVDAGLEALDHLGIKPDILIGDFDTVDERVLYIYNNKNEITVERHNCVKNSTDTELAVDAAIKEDCDEIYILGCFGGRMDHSISNIYLAFRGIYNKKEDEKRIRIYLLDECNKVYAIDEFDKEYSITRLEQWGKYISFFPVGGIVGSLSVSGVKYPLSDRTINLYENPSLTTSNEIVENKATISVKDGILIIVESKDKKI